MTVATVTGFAFGRPVSVKYGRDIEAEIEHMTATIAQVPALTITYRPRWLAIQLLENDDTLQAEVQTTPGAAGTARDVGASGQRTVR